MRRFIGFIVSILFVGTMYGQSIHQSNVPAVVLNSFQLKFPNAEDSKWKLDKGNYYVSCKVNNKSNKITLNDRGKVLKHSQDLYVSEIPPAVLATIGSRVKYYDVHDADRMEENGDITYEIKFKIDGKDYFFQIKDKGELLKFRKELKDSEVPASIINLINTIYGEMDIERAKFVEEPKQTIYMLRGEINDYDHAFTFDQHANILKHSQDLAKSEIPVSILNVLKDSYPGFEIRDADLIEDAGTGVYILKLRKSREKLTVKFSPQGKILEVK
jgi:uncharacterized membrane protein YkoI